jgi:hypothetical protein
VSDWREEGKLTVVLVHLGCRDISAPPASESIAQREALVTRMLNQLVTMRHTVNSESRANIIVHNREFSFLGVAHEA